MTDLDITAIREEIGKLRSWSVFAPKSRKAGYADAADTLESTLTALESSRAVVERLQGELDAQTVEWGVQMIADGRVIDAKTVAADELVNHMPEAWRHVSRKVSPWLPVPTDGAEN